ncbi:MAG: peptide chain release factor N(5)-glutamine methyltransferase [Bacteroidales bacterium]|nr:peptide chain release factor N(5)-glutamine methyltransferase [Bacteroidales bacterium]
MNTTRLRFPSNKVRDIERCLRSELSSHYPEGEALSMMALLFEGFLGWDTTQRLLHRDDTINQSDLLRFHWAVEDLLHDRPIQHIVGYTWFCDCKIGVDPSVLIPRPETEEMVLQTIQQLQATPPHTILDLCTGSGCIAIALAKAFPQADVTAVDLSSEALKKAKENAEANHVAIRLLQDDLLSPTLPLERYDLIVSNPPYIPLSESASMDKNVTAHEPHMALFVPDDDPLCFYRAIGQLAASRLERHGWLVLETHETLAEETRQLLLSMGFSATLHKDFRDRNRKIVARLSQKND